MAAASGAPPLNLAPPLLGGSAEVGKALTVDSTGTWSGNPTGYAYQWKRCDAGGSACATIAGANRSELCAGNRRRGLDDPSRGHGRQLGRHGDIELRPEWRRAGGRHKLRNEHRSGLDVRRRAPTFVDANGPWAVSAPLILTQAHAYMRGTNEDQQLRVVVYADAGGNPGAFLACERSRSRSPPVRPAAGSISPSRTRPRSPTGSYWLGYWLGPIGGGALISCTNGIAGIERYQYRALLVDRPAAQPLGNRGQLNQPVRALRLGRDAAHTT